jgi:hypothetical protein
MKKPNPDKPGRPEGPVGKVSHDARGHAVWQWAAETARNLALSTSQVLRRLDTRSLSLQDEPAPAKREAAHGSTKLQGPGKPQGSAKLQGSQKPQASAKPAPGGGFNPYEGRSVGVKAAAKSPSPRRAPAHSSWWRRLFRRD